MTCQGTGNAERDPRTPQIAERRSHLVRLLARGATRALAGRGDGSEGPDLHLEAAAKTGTDSAKADDALPSDRSPDRRLGD